MPVHHSEVNNHYYGKVYDSSKKEIQVKEIPGPVQTIVKEVPQKVDTSKILKEHYALNIYKQTIGDSSFKATITDSIQQNKLIGRSFQYQLLKPVALVLPNRSKLFAGIRAGAGRSGISSIGPEVTLITKKDHLYSAGYNLVDNSFNVGIGWKLELKK
jgi:hypothetical protein